MNSLLAILITLLSSVSLSGIDTLETKTLFSFSNDSGPIYVLAYYDDGSQELLDACEFYEIPCTQHNAVELAATMAWADVLDFLLKDWMSPDWLQLDFTLFEDGSFSASGCIGTLQCGYEETFPCITDAECEMLDNSPSL